LNELVSELGYHVEDLGNVHVPSVHAIEGPIDPKARFEPQIASVCEDVAKRVRQCVKEGRFPISLGGDHSAAVGTIR
jgi:arginase